MDLRSPDFHCRNLNFVKTQIALEQWLKISEDPKAPQHFCHKLGITYIPLRDSCQMHRKAFTVSQPYKLLNIRQPICEFALDLETGLNRLRTHELRLRRIELSTIV